ncbi:high mobility group B protein 15 isoform X2 [Nicotiana tabacum]|uniref:High mobility group B protein 15 isoform X2 n=1 Tax=Nicotiana tabacum TaxID=4097 RepID=A0AC58SK99_TOBAC
MVEVVDVAGCILIFCFTFRAETASPSTGSPVCGVIDGKFESGYLITVKIGSEDFKETAAPSTGSPVCGVIDGKFESGYLITVKIGSEDFKEQHARLKPLYPGNDREISRMIGELWNNLNVPEKMIYQEKALQDKERYRLEMEDYRERLKTGQVVSNPLQMQLPLEHNVDMIDVQSELPSENGNVSWSPEYRPSSDKCAQSNWENNKGTNPNLDAKAPANNAAVEALGDVEEFELLKRVDMVECEDK